MEKYNHKGNDKTPTINFDLTTGVLELKGWSIPDNSIEFYVPLMEALDVYANAVQPKTKVTVEIEYFNTSSSKCLLNVFKKLEKINRGGSEVEINWHYEKDDEDMAQAGEDYQNIVNLPFKMVMVQL
jgi:hypothetical protein